MDTFVPLSRPRLKNNYVENIERTSILSKIRFLKRPFQWCTQDNAVLDQQTIEEKTSDITERLDEVGGVENTEIALRSPLDNQLGEASLKCRANQRPVPNALRKNIHRDA
jgi:hypothetical protein